MSRDAILCLKQLPLPFLIRLVKVLCFPHQYARKTRGNAFSRCKPRFHAKRPTVFRKPPLTRNLNHNLTVRTTCSTRIRCQTFSNSWVEQNLNFRVLAARLKPEA